MTIQYGVTPTGFVIKPQSVILAEIEADQLATISPTLDVSADQPQGQFNGIFSQREAMIWELAQDTYNSFDRDSAEDASLDNIGKLSGTDRGAARYSIVTCTCDVDIGTELDSGVHFAAVDGHPDVRFTPQADFVSPADGSHSIVFRSEFTGPVVALAGTLDVIATAVVGWNSVTNAGDAAPGADVEDDPDYRASQEAALAEAGSSTVDAIRSHLLDDVPGIQTCTVLENIGDTTDGNGLPPHSFLALLYDGTTDGSGSSADAIAQSIWDHRPGGIRPFGSSSGTATDKLGNPQTVAFTRVAAVQIYVTMTLSTTTGYVGSSAVIAALVLAANAQFKEAGQTVIALFVRALPLAQLGVRDVLTFAIGTAPSPTLGDNVTIGAFQVARFDSANITVTP